MGIKNPEEKLNEALKIITKKVENDKNTTYIDEAILHRIITAEYTKTFLTKDVDVENKEGYFVVYKRIIVRLIEMIEAVNPNYNYSKSLASSVVEGILHQRYLKEHFTSITNLTEKDCLFEFYSDLVKKALQ